MTLFFVFLLILLLFISGFSSASETALFSLSPLKIKAYEKNQSPRRRLIAKLVASPRDLLVTLLILNMLANLLVQNTVSSLFDNFSSWGLKVGVPLFLTLIFGEILPKSIALPFNEEVSFIAAFWLNGLAKMTAPIRKPLVKITSWISRFLFFFFSKEKEISIEELRHVVKTSKESKILLPQECRLIEGSLNLQSSLVKERMRPREEIFFYDLHDPIDDLYHLMVDKAITRVPICDGNLENLLGVFSVRSFFHHRSQIQQGKDLLPFLSKPYYVPESIRAWSLLKNLKEKGESLAIVVDEYGSISGLVTKEDLVEAVVGEITDKRDEKLLYSRSGEDVIIASGKLELLEFETIFGIHLPTKENIVTLGGWLIEQLGDIPPVGTKYANDHFLFYVLAAEPNRIRRIYVRRLQR